MPVCHNVESPPYKVGQPRPKAIDQSLVGVFKHSPDGDTVTALGPPRVLYEQVEHCVDLRSLRIVGVAYSSQILARFSGLNSSADGNRLLLSSQSISSRLLVAPPRNCCGTDCNDGTNSESRLSSLRNCSECNVPLGNTIIFG